MQQVSPVLQFASLMSFVCDEISRFSICRIFIAQRQIFVVSDLLCILVLCFYLRKKIPQYWKEDDDHGQGSQTAKGLISGSFFSESHNIDLNFIVVFEVSFQSCVRLLVQSIQQAALHDHLPCLTDDMSA